MWRSLYFDRISIQFPKLDIQTSNIRYRIVETYFFMTKLSQVQREILVARRCVPLLCVGPVCCAATLHQEVLPKLALWTDAVLRGSAHVRHLACHRFLVFDVEQCCVLSWTALNRCNEHCQHRTLFVYSVYIICKILLLLYLCTRDFKHWYKVWSWFSELWTPRNRVEKKLKYFEMRCSLCSRDGRIWEIFWPTPALTNSYTSCCKLFLNVSKNLLFQTWLLF